MGEREYVLSDIFYKKKLGIPYLSFIFILSCLLVTIPTYFYPELYKVFGGSQQKYYIWQYITLIFEHGSYKMPIFAHLIANIVVIVFFGVIAERLLGAKRFLILTVSTAITFYITMFYMNGLYGNGSYGIIWAYTSISFFIVIYLYRYDKHRLINDPLFYLCILLLIIFWILVTIVDYRIHGKISYGIKSHFISVSVGFIFVFIWKDYIKNKIKDFMSGSYEENKVNSVTDKIIKKVALLVPTFIIIILLSACFGFLKNHISPVKIVNITPINSLEALNKEDQQIFIKFSHPMRKECKKSSLYSISEKQHSAKLHMDLNWINNQTLKIKLNRKVYKDEKIKIVIKELSDINGLVLKEDIILKYGYNN